MKYIAIIPARYASSRFPGKPLVEIKGLPMVVYVWRNISQSKLLGKVIVATDNEKISEVLNYYDVPYVMTDDKIPTGTDRIYNAYLELNERYEVIINVQGDEPLLMGEDIDLLIRNFDTINYDVATFITKINNIEELINPNNVKVVVGKKQNAIYFSRATVPFLRDFPLENWLQKQTYWRHIGIYAYKYDVLESFVKANQTNLELCEKLEQLRLLEMGYKFQCIPLNKTLIGIDTPNDLNQLQILLNNAQNL